MTPQEQNNGSKRKRKQLEHYFLQYVSFPVVMFCPAYNM